MIVATIRVHTSAENRKELMQTFRFLSEPTLSESGCRSCRIYREVGDDQAVILIQEWDSRDAWDNHVHSNEFAVMIGAMSLVDKPESVRFQLLDLVEGAESLEAMRARNFNQGDEYEFPKTGTRVSPGRFS